MEIDMSDPMYAGGSWLQRPKRETAIRPPKDKPTAKAFDESKVNRDPGGPDGGQFTSGGGGVSDTPAKEPGSVQSIGQKELAPKWKKSKDPDNEFGHTVTYAGRSYEIYHDPERWAGTRRSWSASTCPALQACDREHRLQQGRCHE